jgi:TfoX/Sxy family transcriptional regulator of competence genes
MASDPSFVDFVCDQLRPVGGIVSSKMFGEYAIHREDKFVALICDNKLFVKPTAWGDSNVAGIATAPPYPGAKPYYWITDRLEDAEWLCWLVRNTADALPAPKPKGAKKAARKGGKKAAGEPTQ